MATRTVFRRPVVRILLGILAAAFVAALIWFEPWLLVIDHQVNEALPVAATSSSQVEPVVVARGQLIGHEHAGSGTVEILKLADGSRVLRVEDLDTSNGPKLRVWLTDAPVIEGSAGWYVFDDGRHVDLGDLKGNVGSSNYAIPADVDLTGLTSATIWCDRFSVSFTAAALQPVTP